MIRPLAAFPTFDAQYGGCQLAPQSSLTPDEQGERGQQAHQGILRRLRRRPPSYKLCPSSASGRGQGLSGVGSWRSARAAPTGHPHPEQPPPVRGRERLFRWGFRAAGGSKSPEQSDPPLPRFGEGDGGWGEPPGAILWETYPRKGSLAYPPASSSITIRFVMFTAFLSIPSTEQYFSTERFTAFSTSARFRLRPRTR